MDGIRGIPTDRVLQRLDAYLGVNDYEAAERHLRYWIAEAESGNDRRGMLTVLNEQIGLYRKTGKETEGLAAARAALDLAEELGLMNTVVMGTTLVNVATALKAFDRPQEALPLYEKARGLYEALLESDDARLGGLYNNMALTVMAQGGFRRAEELFCRALKVMEKAPNGEAEMAITYCNLADLVAAEQGTEQGEAAIAAYLEKAMVLLDTEHLPRNGYYAFVCEKCAPTFGYYGYYGYENELTERVKKIYEGA